VTRKSSLGRTGSIAGLVDRGRDGAAAARAAVL